MEILTVPRVLRQKLGEDGTDSLIELFNKSNEKQRQDVLVFVEEKFERRLTEENSKINQRIIEETSKINQRITEENSRLHQKISETKADIIKWMFIFWLGQIGALLGILFAFFKR